MKCSVIIPYYQREPGVLRRALKSVFAQSHPDFDVIVVDDSSPLPVEAEIGLLPPAQRRRIAVIKQANAGPGGARVCQADRRSIDRLCGRYWRGEGLTGLALFRHAFDAQGEDGGRSEHGHVPADP